MKRPPQIDSNRSEAIARGNCRRRRTAKRTLLALIAVLYVLSVPWYRDPTDEVRVVLGLPDWVAIALACYVGVALCNAAAWLLAEVPEQPEIAEDTAASVSPENQR